MKRIKHIRKVRIPQRHRFEPKAKGLTRAEEDEIFYRTLNLKRQEDLHNPEKAMKDLQDAGLVKADGSVAW